MVPLIAFNWVAILAAVAVSFCFGFLWYGPVFGKIWARLTNLPADYVPTSKSLVSSILINVFGTLLLVMVFQNSLDVWRPTSWGFAGSDKSFLYYGFFTGFFTWLGFFIPQVLNSVAWERRGWSLFALNASYHFFNLQIIGLIIAYWH